MGIAKRKLENQILKEKAYEDAKKHCKQEQIFDVPNRGGDMLTKIYSNEYYVVYEQKYWGYNEILDKEKYGDNWYVF